MLFVLTLILYFRRSSCCGHFKRWHIRHFRSLSIRIHNGRCQRSSIGRHLCRISRNSVVDFWCVANNISLCLFHDWKCGSVHFDCNVRDHVSHEILSLLHSGTATKNPRRSRAIDGVTRQRNGSVFFQSFT